MSDYMVDGAHLSKLIDGIAGDDLTDLVSKSRLLISAYSAWWQHHLIMIPAIVKGKRDELTGSLLSALSDYRKTLTRLSVSVGREDEIQLAMQVVIMDMRDNSANGYPGFDSQARN